MRNIIKYVGIALVIVGILLVMKNLFSKETNWDTNKTKEETKEIYYSARIKLLDKETNSYLPGAKLILKDENNKVIGEWTTEEGIHTINKLSKGKYTLEQISAPENYKLNKDNITFVIKNDDKLVTMYNVKMTEEEIRAINTTSKEVGVDNTASNKSILSIIIAIMTTTLGLNIIYKVKKNY